MGIECELPALAGFGLLLQDTGLGLGVAAVDPDDRTVEVDAWHQRRAETSPRREPVIMVSQSSRPQSGSVHAVLSRAAASVALGGSGSVRCGDGASAIAALLSRGAASGPPFEQAADVSRVSRNCPETDTRSARWWPWDLPSGGHLRCCCPVR